MPRLRPRPRMGTTSACAENTTHMAPNRWESGNYLRVRGEYILDKKISFRPAELPPRARRIRPREVHGVDDGGTTSACAENTIPLLVESFLNRNYLRVRGEYVCLVIATSWSAELPPRARRIQALGFLNLHRPGTTSACAENTIDAVPDNLKGWNYLRVRGEYGQSRLWSPEQPELPPRARRILPPAPE